MKPARAFGETKSKGGFVEAQAELARMVCPANDAAPQLERRFASYAENEWSQYMRDRWKWTTQTTQGSFVTQHIRPYFDSLALPEITPAKIAAFHQALEAKGLGKKTRKNIHAILHTMFEYAVETLELLPKSPVKKRLAPKVEKHEKPSLTPGQAWELWDMLAGAEQSAIAPSTACSCSPASALARRLG